VQHVVIFNVTLTWILFLLAVDQVLCTVRHQVTSTNDPQTGSVLHLAHIRTESNDIHLSKQKMQNNGKALNYKEVCAHFLITFFVILQTSLAF
jgi:hypothetical protein